MIAFRSPCRWLVWLMLGFGIVSGSRCANAQSSPPWNVLLILIDDMGWSDLQYAGSDYYESPCIDRLASQSVQFRQAYAAAPVCSPTRAAILTGKCPARTGLTIWHEAAVSGGPRDRPLRDAPSATELAHEHVTLAELFQARGYFTAHIGKWHLGLATHYPETQGYEHHVGGTHWGAPSSFFFPYHGPFVSTEGEFRYVPGLSPGQKDDYLTDRLTDRALEAIAAAGDRPFFMTLWHYAVHSPIEAPAPLVEKYRKKKPGQFHHDPTYAAMIENLDQNVGRVLDELDRRHLADRTVVIFTSDNGGVDIPVRYTTPTSNLPLRSGKGTLYEGGIRVPLLIRWPQSKQGGSRCDQMVTSEDLFATLVDQFQLTSQIPLGQDGVSLVPLLDNPAKALDRERLFWHFPHYYARMTPASAIRWGPWKLIHSYETDEVELYHLKDDPGESRDLAEQMPTESQRLRAELDRWRTEVNASRCSLPGST